MVKANFRRRGGAVRRKRAGIRRVGKRGGGGWGGGPRRRPARRRPNRRGRGRTWYNGNERTLSITTLSTSTGGSSAGINSPPTDDGSGSSHLAPTESYLIIKKGIRQSIPAAIVLWAFYKAAPGEGLTSRRVTSFITRYRRTDELKRSGMTVSSLLNYAVEFGLLERRGNHYFLVKKDKRGR